MIQKLLKRASIVDWLDSRMLFLIASSHKAPWTEDSRCQDSTCTLQIVAAYYS